MSQVSPISAFCHSSNSTNARRPRRQVRGRLERTCERLTERLQQASAQLVQLQERNRRLNQHVQFLDEQLRSVQIIDEKPADTHAFTHDPPLWGHQFGLRLIALCIELSKRIGFGSTEFVIEKVFQTLQLDLKVPSHDAIEQWSLRFGVAELQDSFTKDQNVLWMADHSSQIGKEKVLLIIGIALDDLPTPGQSLNLNDVKVLAIVPGEHWKKEDVDREYQLLAARIGAPVYLLCDGATELRDPAKNLEKDGQKTIILGDLKHHAANLLEKQIGRSEQFETFMKEVRLTRNRVQQTELSHFAPPALRHKSRFMNLASLLSWGQMVLYHLDDLNSPSRTAITEERMQEKLGWLLDFRGDLTHWSECQEVIDRALHVINLQGLSGTSVEQLRESLSNWLDVNESAERAANRLARSLYQYVQESAEKLRPDTSRAWLSTEILESLFGRFKRLERQHCRGGFTRLVAAIPTLCRTVDAALVRKRFSQTKSGDVKSWLKSKLGESLASRRNTAYRLFSASTI